MNPYEPPESANPDAADPTSAPARRFRWGVIPAAFSFVFGGTALVAVSVGLYRIVFNLRHSPPGTLERDSLFEMLVVAGCFMITGVLNVLAGAWWLNGRWIPALILNTVAFIGMGNAEAIVSFAFDVVQRM
jgi:hypothetical protein